MEDLILITDLIKSILNYPLNIFGYYITIMTVVVGTILLSITTSFVVKIFGGD